MCTPSQHTKVHNYIVYTEYEYTPLYSYTLSLYNTSFHNPQDNMMVVVGGGLGERWIRPFWVSHFRLSPASYGLQATRPTKQHSMAPQPPPIIIPLPHYILIPLLYQCSFPFINSNLPSPVLHVLPSSKLFECRVF